MSEKCQGGSGQTLHRTLDWTRILIQNERISARRADMDAARYHPRPRRLVLLVSTFLALLAQPAAWAEGVVRKVGVVTIVGRDAAIRSPLWKILTDVARSTAPD